MQFITSVSSWSLASRVSGSKRPCPAAQSQTRSRGSAG